MNATTASTAAKTGKTTKTKHAKNGAAAPRQRRADTGGPRTTKQRIEDEVADRIIDLLDRGELPPWEKDWQDSPLGFQVNAVSMKRYRGINQWLTLLTQQVRGYRDPRWLTFRQAAGLGGHVREGETATRIVFWKRVTFRNGANGAEDAEGVETINQGEVQGPVPGRTYPMLRAYNVFNVEQTEGCKLKELPAGEWLEHDPLEMAEAIIAGMPDPPGFETYGESNRAPHYAPEPDVVRVPEIGRFVTPESYYSTVFHELVHATGHPDRLARFEIAADNLHDYGREELVAGMGSAMLAAHAGIGGRTIERDASYIRHWRDAISADKAMVIRAATLAQKASDLVLGVTAPEFRPEKPETKPEPETAAV